MFLGNALRTDVPVDGARSHRDRRHVTRHAPVINRNVGHASADIHDGHPLLLLIGREYGFGRRQRIGEYPQHTDTEPPESHVEPLQRRLAAKYEVESRRQPLAERTDRIAHLLGIIHHIMLRNTLHDRFVVGGLDVAHTIEQGIYIALVHPVLGIVGKDVVGMAGTTDELARNAGISLRNSNAERRFHLGDSLPDGIARLFDIIDPAGLDPLDRFGNDGFDTERSVFAFRPDSDHHVRRTEVDGYRITLFFHCALSIFSLNRFPASSLPGIFRRQIRLLHLENLTTPYRRPARRTSR